MRRRNRAVIFRAIHVLGPIARIDLAKTTGLNAATVSSVVDELLTDGIVIESGVHASGRVGRRPVHLAIAATARYAIGVDLARDVTTAAVVDLAGTVHAQVSGPGAGDGDDADQVLEPVVGLIRRLLDDLPRPARRGIVGVGVGLPSPVRMVSAQQLAPHSFGHWRTIDARTELGRRLRLPVYADNNANASALAELCFGAGRTVDDFVLLTLGTGVGAGVVVDGRLYRGHHDIAGEAGHVTISVDGRPCACGSRGCLETYVSAPAIVRTVRARLASGSTSTLADAADRGELTLGAVIAAFEQRDRLARTVFARVARQLAAGIVNLLYTLDPALVLLGREVAHAGEEFLQLVREAVEARVFPGMRDNWRIDLVRLPDAPVVGAAALALGEYFPAALEASPSPL